MPKPLVTVICMAYNHEPYIRSALEGFVMQKTDFPFEVIVHDDASTDGTAAIIREYEERYPNIIKPIYQQENQYSKPVDIMKYFILPNSQGKYVALCEGDDYWTAPNKLQMQADFLESHSDYSACAHLTRILNLAYYGDSACERLIGDRAETLSPNDGGGQNVPIDLLLMGSSNCFHTSSMMFQKAVLETLPPFYFACPGVGDYPLKIYLALLGKIYRFNAVQSTYRLMVPGSWTIRTHTVSQQIVTLKNCISMLEQVDSYTDGCYSDIIKRSIQEKQIQILLMEKKYSALHHSELNTFFKQYTLTKRVALVVGYGFPWAMTLYNRFPVVNRLYNAISRKNKA